MNVRGRAAVFLPALLVILLIAGAAVAGGAAAKEVKDEGPLALVPRLDATKPPSYVGVDSAGRLVGVAFTAEGELVAYVCDGEDTGVWFTGKYAEGDTSATLKAKKGASLTLDLTSEPLTGTVTIGGTEETFTLAPAVGSAGIYRERKGKQLSGWIVDNGGAIWGVSADGSGKVVNSVQVGTPVAQSAPTGDSGDPVPTGFFKCAAAQFRLERESKKLANGGSSAGSFQQAQDARDAACP